MLNTFDRLMVAFEYYHESFLIEDQHIEVC
jgi:hypothetical protein